MRLCTFPILGLAAGLLAGVTVLTLEPRAAAAEATCAPVAIVEGPAEIAQPTLAILRRHGLGDRPDPCAPRVIRASMTPAGAAGTYLLRIEDGFGRAADRRASDPETAASLIESWAFDEDAGLLAPRPLPAPAEPLAAPAEALSLQLEALPVAEVAPVAPVWRLLVAAELSMNTDSSTLLGGGATACRMLGPVCLGVRGRYAQGTQEVGEGPMQRAWSRTLVDALAMLGFPATRGRLTAMPLIAIGAGWSRAIADRPFPDGPWDPGPQRAPFEPARADVSVRAEGGLIVSVALARGWSIVGELSASRGEIVDQGVAMRERRDGPPLYLPAPAVTSLRTGLGIGYAP